MDKPLAKHLILGVHISNRLNHVGEVQNVLSEFGGQIRTRLGLHETGDDYCSPNGLLILELLDHEEKKEELKGRLNAIDGVEVKEMVFDHP